jgi:hypothetical protein
LQPWREQANSDASESSPVEGPLRRLPGQSIRDERDKLLNDTASDYLLLIAIVWVFGGLGMVPAVEPVGNCTRNPHGHGFIGDSVLRFSDGSLTERNQKSEPS